MRILLLSILVLGSQIVIGQDPVFVLNPEGHHSGISKLLVTNDKSTIISFGDDKSICFWDANSGALLKKRWLDIGQGEAGRIIDADLGLKTGLLAIARINSQGRFVVNLIDLTKDKVLGTFEGFSQELGFVRIDPNEKFLITGSFQLGNEKSEPIRLWKIPYGTTFPFTIKAPSAETSGFQSHDLCLYDDGKKLFMTGWGNAKALAIEYDPSSIPEYKFLDIEPPIKPTGHVKNIPSINKVFYGDHKGNVYLLGVDGVKQPLFNRSQDNELLGNSINDVFVNETGSLSVVIINPAKNETGQFLEVLNLKTKTRIYSGKSHWYRDIIFVSDSVIVAHTEFGLIRHNFLRDTKRVMFKPVISKNNSMVQFGPHTQIAFDSLSQLFGFETLEFSKLESAPNGFSKQKLSYHDNKISFFNDSINIKLNGSGFFMHPSNNSVWSVSYLNSGKIIAYRNEYRTNRRNLLLYDPNNKKDGWNHIPETEFIGSQRQIDGIAPSSELTSGHFVTADGFGVISLWDENSEVFRWQYKTQLCFWPFENVNLQLNEKNKYFIILPKEGYTGILKKGDLLLSVNNFSSENQQEMYRHLEGLDPLAPLTVKVRRGKEEISTKLILSKIKIQEPLVSFAALGNNEWLCWTPQGYYASSAGGEKMGGWVINNSANEFAEFHPMYDFKKQFYRPELLKLIPKEGSFKKALESYNRTSENPIKVSKEIFEQLPPSITWLNPVSQDTLLSKNTVRLTALVTSSSALQSAKVLLNGRTVLRRDQLIIKRERDLPNYLVSFDIDLVALESTINLFTENEFGSTVSEERVLRLKQLETGIEKYKPNLYLLSVGVSNHTIPAYRLNFADKDASAISTMYESQKGLLFKNVFARTLINENATRANILDAFYWLEQNATQKDVVVIFMASHGLNEKDKFYILPYDGDPERIRITGVDWFNFSDVLGNLPSKVLVFIDACHSGKLGTNILAKRGDTDLMEAIRSLATEENGVVIMAASTGKESSLESAEWQHGAFTLALLEGMNQGKADLNEDGIINIREIDYYAAERVKELTAGKQHPTTQKPSVVSEFPLIQTVKN
jgi:WD40 repeat protein